MKKFELTIPEPCHENWNKMTPEDKGRFCASCQKTVVDFTGMSDAQLAQFFKKPKGEVCGHFHTDQLNRELSLPKKRLPWLKYFFGIVLPALFFSKKATAQGEVKAVESKTTVCDKSKSQQTPLHGGKFSSLDTAAEPVIRMGFVSHKMKLVNDWKIFKGRVTNASGDPVPFATVSAKAEGRLVVADSAGYFSIKHLSFPLLLEVSSVGYQTQQTVCKTVDESVIVLKQRESFADVDGMVIVTHVRKKQTAAAVTKPPPKDNPSSKEASLIQAFSVYPNPVAGSGLLAVDPKNLELGQYNFSLLSAAGSEMQSGKFVFEREKTKQTIALQNLHAGVYFLRLVNSKNGKTFTQEVIVQ